jgi:hypothetical protein
MQLRTLQFGLYYNLQRFKAGLLRAVKRNASLCVVAGEIDSSNRDNLFNQEETRRLNYYAERNKVVSRWIASSTSVPREAWPRALAAARVTGPGTVYRILQALGSSVGAVEGKRKRKRPIRYAP